MICEESAVERKGLLNICTSATAEQDHTFCRLLPRNIESIKTPETDLWLFCAGRRSDGSSTPLRLLDVRAGDAEHDHPNRFAR